jgi:MinD superfamily P-loop ATPase
MKELVVISGKGGTGKTSLVGAFSYLADKKVIADCDVDAADLHLLLRPKIIESHVFEGGKKAVIDTEKCIRCRECFTACRFDAISEEIEINEFLCEGCGLCAALCPESAVVLKQEIAGHWFVSTTAYGPFVHARLGIAQENSGLLVAKVREAAKKIAMEEGRDLILIDGSPGVGCAVISSITGAHLVLIVTEPTQSGLHDLKRVMDLTSYFQINTLVCINKYDINREISDRIRQICMDRGTMFAGQIPYDSTVTKAQVFGHTVVEEYRASKAAASMREIWDSVKICLKSSVK